MAPDEVRVFAVTLDQPTAVVEHLDRVLPPEERNAPPRIRVARAAARIALADALRTDAAAVAISRRCEHCGDASHGRPTVVGADRVSFSVSHSGGSALVALAADGTRLGVDLEVVRPRHRLERLAARVLGDDEHRRWATIEDADERLRAFLQTWTAKEAYLKAIGIGIATRLRDVPSRLEGWRIGPIAAGTGRVAALAIDRPEVSVRRARLPAFAEGYRDLVLDDDEDYADGDPAATAAGAASSDGDGDGDADGTLVGHAEPAPIERFRRTSVGTVFAAGLLGLRDVLEPPKDDTPAIVEEWAAREPFTEPIVLRLDPDHPEDSIVMVRPWLNPKRPNP